MTKPSRNALLSSAAFAAAASASEPEYVPELPRYTPRQFCIRYSVGLTRFYELANSGALRVVKDGRNSFVLHADAEAYLRTLPERQPSKAA